ncbi:hypothetical protein [Providencia alcalifaciens]|uniref:phage tail fiber protein n=1 Tax=Providencia alcalifaciens TaxID=126385 RepID=UPI00029C237C|nr:hypothetical protein [Providencia alcalifaciens]EKT65943.1 hypothetical protein OO9_08786 [Providencia alcalifaciens Dmel2]
MIYQTGTVTTTAGQTKIKGTGTRWKDNLAGISEGCPISYLINNVVYMNTVLSVNSDTEINLTYPVPVAASAAKYQIATFVLDSMSDGVRKMLANQQYIQYFLRNMDAWMTQDGIVEVKTPTGETVKLESLVELKKQMDNKLDKTGGTITINSDALNLRNISENQALFLSFQKMDGKRRGYIGAPSDKDRISIVNDLAGTELALTEDKRLTFQGKDVAMSNLSGVVSAPMWNAGTNGIDATFIKLATIGEVGSDAAVGERYQISISDTRSGFNSSTEGAQQGSDFGVITLVVGNGNIASQNIMGTYYCTSHWDVASASVSSVIIRQLSAYCAEIWLRAGPYSRYTCIMNSVGKFTPHTGILDGGIVPSNNGDKSTYYIQKVRKFITSDKDGIQEYTNVRGLDVVGKTEYTNIRLKRQDGTYLSLETVPKQDANASGAGFANLIHRDANNTNIAVVAIPNKNGMLMQVGDFGVGATRTEQLIKENNYDNPRNRVFGFIYNNYGAIGAPFDWGGGIVFGRDPAVSSSILYSPDWSTKLYFRAAISNEKMSDWVEFYSTGNTTKDSNGNLKAASPIVKLFADDIELNDESEGVEMEHLGIGHYLIKGVIGFNADGAWGINNGFVIPQDHNGKNMVLIDYEVRPDGDIEVFVFHQQNAEMPERFQNKRIKYFDEEGAPVYFENYEPCDVPESRWIDMRVEMPPNSIYNQKLAEAVRLAKIEAERVAKEEAEKAAREEAERLEEESKQEQAS